MNKLSQTSTEAQSVKLPVVLSKLRLFIIGSIGIHLGIAVIWGIPEYIKRQERQRQIEEARQLAEARKESEKKAKELAKKEILAATKRDIVEELKKDFAQITQNEIDAKMAEDVWNDVMDDIQEDIERYAEELANANATDADLRNALTNMKRKMIGRLNRRMREITARQLAAQFLKKIEEQVAPKVAEHLQKEIEQKVGEPLKNEGAKIAQEEKNLVERERQAIKNALDNAAKETDRAQKETANAKDRVEKAIADSRQKQKNAHEQSANAVNTLEAVKQRMSAAEINNQQTDKNIEQQAIVATKCEQAAAERAKGALKNVEASLKKAAASADAFGESLKKEITETSEKSAQLAQKETGELKETAQQGKPFETIKKAGEAAEATKKLGDDVAKAKASAEKAEFDPVALARAVMKDVKDSKIKTVMTEAFKKGFDQNTLPRLSEKLKDQFQSQLNEQGLKDEKIVSEVGKKIKELLGEKTLKDAKAAESSTQALEKSEKLSEAKSSDKKNCAREKKVGEKIEQAAKSLADKTMNEITKNDRHDETFVKLAAPNVGAQNEKKDLIERLANLAANVNEGRMGFLDSGSAGISKMRKEALFRHQKFGHLIHSTDSFSLAIYASLTKGIHERDQKAAQGEIWERKAAEGEATINEASKDVVRYAALLMPPESKIDLAGEVEKKEPYKPQFKTINFGIVPFAQEAIKLDGDLKEWQNISSMPMRKCWDGKRNPNYKVVEPQFVKVVWDNTGFYFAYDVKDADNKIQKAKADNFWESDAVEIWFDALNTKDKKRGSAWAQQFWIWPFGMAGDSGKTGGEAIMDTASNNYIYTPYTAANIQRVAKQTTDGWIMEAHIPVEQLKKLELQPGRIIGFNLSICTGTNLYYYWGGNDDVRTSERPDTWGDILLAGSDSKLEFPDHLATELKDGETAKPARALIIGDALKIRLTDPDMNLSDKRKDRISVTVKSQHGDNEVITLEETTEKSGIFEGSLRTALSLGEPVSGTLSLYEGETIEVIYIDQARADGARNVEVKRSIKVAIGITTMLAAE